MTATPTVTGQTHDGDLQGLFLRLIALDDGTIPGILAVVMDETLEPGSTPIDLLCRN